ncbi:hypothetical protein O181_003865 [Austropuccinia psidii MF-1]|uniref:RING-type domain-containing protein n=1 Tax=Austropuccinia psidii MF-1 TaxID=1389203 RepID=A0A9Q3BF87_9BASI|nr:hypothetical protein [Austropuccinia psidii MF-1]
MKSLLLKLNSNQFASQELINPISPPTNSNSQNSQNSQNSENQKEKDFNFIKSTKFENLKLISSLNNNHKIRNSNKNSNHHHQSCSNSNQSHHQSNQSHQSHHQSISHQAHQAQSHDCPVCLEDLNFKLNGEKPLVSPDCGHQLHATCFEVIYGSIELAKNSAKVSGLCGICRKDIQFSKLHSNHNKLFQLNSDLNHHQFNPHLDNNLNTNNNTNNNLNHIKSSNLKNFENSISKVSKSFSNKFQLLAGISSPSSSTHSNHSNHPNHSIKPLSNHSINSSQKNQIKSSIHTHSNHQINSISSSNSNSLTNLDQEDKLFHPHLDLFNQNSFNTFHSISDSLSPFSNHHHHHHHPTNHLNQSIPSIKPLIKLISENSNLIQNSDPNKSQHLTCLISIQLISKFPYSRPPLPPPLSFLPFSTQSLNILQSTPTNVIPSPSLDIITLSPPPQTSPGWSSNSLHNSVNTTPSSINSPLSTNHSSSYSNLDQTSFHPALDDLIIRLKDSNLYSFDRFGPLKKYHQLQIEKDHHSRQFWVYLFDHVLLFLSEIKNQTPSNSTLQDNLNRKPIKFNLKLKGRVYLNHIDSIIPLIDQDSNLYRLQIKLNHLDFDTFFIKFNDLNLLTDWFTIIQSSINHHSSTLRQSNQKKNSINPSRSSNPLSENSILSSSSTISSLFTKTNSLSFLPTNHHNFQSNLNPHSNSNFQSSSLESHQIDPNLNHLIHSNQSNHLSSLNFSSSINQNKLLDHDQKLILSNHLHHRQSNFHHWPPPYSNPSLTSNHLRHDLPPIDLSLIISLPTLDFSNLHRPSSSNLKLRLLKDCLEFLICHLHPSSRLCLVAYSSGINNQTSNHESFDSFEESNSKYNTSSCQMHYTPFLSLANSHSLKRIHFAILQIYNAGQSHGVLSNDNLKYFLEFDLLEKENTTLENGLYENHIKNVDLGKLENQLKMIEKVDEKVSVLSALNIAYDKILQRQEKNRTSGILLLNDGCDFPTKPEMALAMTRAEVANIPIHTIGWGKGHNPTSLWQLSNHTGGTYTFVKDWYSIKEAIVGCVGGMLSVGIKNLRVQISLPDPKWFKVKKLSGSPNAVVSSNGNYAELEIQELRFGERRDILVEIEMKSKNEVSKYQQSHQVSQDQFTKQNTLVKIETGTDAFFMRHLGKPLSQINDANFYESEFDDMDEEVPLLEVDVSYQDSQTGKKVTRLTKPILLSVIVSPSSNHSPKLNLSENNSSWIIRRRVELLTSDMLTQALLLISRRMERQALRLLIETQTIVVTLMGNLFSLQSDVSNGKTGLTNSQDPSIQSSIFQPGLIVNHQWCVGRRALNIIEPLMRSGKMKRSWDQVEIFLVMAGCLEIIEKVLDGVEELQRKLTEANELDERMIKEINLEELKAKIYFKFESNLRNFAAEQSGILREQKAWLISCFDSKNSRKTNQEDRPDSRLDMEVTDKLEISESDETNQSIIEEIYFNSDYSIWMRNMIQNWISTEF